ncbi:L,D-transpeptidase [Roseibium marinum]|uniref:L,D-transpeptidase-like protein n=1 Tax=Roseibium marinum TaxID=281252 RepID=A0A2S3UM66_9HYPH|nr:L,D-transpeptidase [Roseibium marinum]POF28660.1 L,D-transpeptidase-like protein [Roseibium marinum]
MLKFQKFVVAPLLLAFLVLTITGANAAQKVTATIDLSEQRLYLYVDGRLRDKWAVSTARKGYRTPVGSYRPTRLERDWHSRKYDWAPMPYSIFFLGGYAIHGTTDLKHLGQPASHGCIRLHPDHAARLFNLVQQVGKASTRIVVRR